MISETVAFLSVCRSVADLKSHDTKKETAKSIAILHCTKRRLSRLADDFTKSKENQKPHKNSAYTEGHS